MVTWKLIGYKLFKYLFVLVDDNGNQYIADPGEVAKEVRQLRKQNGPPIYAALGIKKDNYRGRPVVLISKTEFSLDD